MMTNFPYGFVDGVSIRGVPILQTNPGQVFWLGNGSVLNVDQRAGSDSNRGTYLSPFGTLAGALAQCVAGRNDIIMVLPGHAETISDAVTTVMNKAGVAVVGLGSGALRPVFTFSGAASAIPITAASCSLQNILCQPAAGTVSTGPIAVQAADCYIDMEWRDVTATTAEAQRVVLTTAAADNLYIKLKHSGLAGSTACVNSIRLVGCNNGKINVDFFGVASTAVVEFLTTACSNVEVRGNFFNVGTALTKNIVDTVTGSTWVATQCFDGVGGYSFNGGSGAALSSSSVGTVLADQVVPAPDAATNVLMRDVIGNKSDAAVATVGVTASILAYTKGIINSILVPTADAVTNVFSRDVSGNKSDAAVSLVGTTASLMAYIKGLVNNGERQVTSATAVMVNGNTIFTVTGDIQILGLVSECVTGNDATASTLQYQSAPTVGAAATMSGASASLANALAGASVALLGTTLATAPNLVASGANLGVTNPLFCPAGTIKIVVGVGSTTGTWKHYLRYRPLEVGATVV